VVRRCPFICRRSDPRHFVGFQACSPISALGFALPSVSSVSALGHCLCFLFLSFERLLIPHCHLRSCRLAGDLYCYLFKPRRPLQIQFSSILSVPFFSSSPRAGHGPPATFLLCGKSGLLLPAPKARLRSLPSEWQRGWFVPHLIPLLDCTPTFVTRVLCPLLPRCFFMRQIAVSSAPLHHFFRLLPLYRFPPSSQFPS